MGIRKRTVRQEVAYAEMMLALHVMNSEMEALRLKQALIPPEWHRIEDRVPVRPKKTKLTVAFDADLVRWFRNMGQGYQARMNAILRTFMLARLSKEILGNEYYNFLHHEIWGLKAPPLKL